MMHPQRHWCVSLVENADELARKLTGQTWTLCTGFSVIGHEKYLFLNDATNEDGVSEYGVVRVDGTECRQVESITFLWCTMDQALTLIRQALAGEMDGNDFARPVHPHLDTPEQHGRCHLCA